ncbi:hypothetical protein EDM22_17825 [Agromyces tardus]|uniref:Uncharacterized protein n=1 Tax=Agromyces tardus TaxID=2583849 RepID=A0A3M7ZZL9_9MICO|nr:hypothetical protein [Agromyces tardus]RNB44161.1 hypothetical protein EDM22_17825 [Agromyces tardus]
MPTLTIPRRAAAALAAAATAVLIFTGCSANPVGDLVNQGVEDAVESATGGDVNLDGGLPADFPDQVPVVDGTVTFSGGAPEGEGWLVILTPTAADPVAAASAELEAAGFAADKAAAGDAGAAAVYSNSEYVVLLASDGDTLTYTVTKAAQ